MKKFFYFFSLIWCCVYLSPLYAQTGTACNAEFSYNVNGHAVSFHSLPTLPAGTAHWWTFGDPANSPEANPTHTYLNAGTYWVTHYIENLATNCRDSFVRAVTITDTVSCPISAAFSWHRDSANCRKVIFSNQSTPISPNVHFVWKFGDGTTSNDVNVSHTYAQDGVYTVCLVMESGNNCRKEVCKQIEVRCQPACNLEVKFEFRKDTLNPLKIYFINNTIVPSAGAQYLWTFGDGSSSNDKNPVHTYAAPGVYKVCLKVTISNTCVATTCKEINVQLPPPPPACNVHARFEWRRDSLQWNKIWFANVSQPVQNIWRTSWTYGDGTSSQDFNSFHVYQQPGKYYVCLKVQSLNGCISTYCDSVQVRQPFNCDDVKVRFEYTRNAERPYIVTFHAVGNTPIVQQTWSILKISNVPVFPPPMPVLLNTNNPTYTFKDSGLYLVCLYAVTANNCKRTYCERIYIEHGQNGRMLTSGSIPVYPNPANKIVKLDVQMENAGLIQVRVLDGTGAPKMQFVSPGKAGSNNLVIPVEKLSNGLYVVEIRYGNQLKLAKFQKS